MSTVGNHRPVKSEDPNERWLPSAVPGIGRELTNAQMLACAVRHLATTGFSENLGGHLTWVDGDGPEGSMLVNPWGLWWEEVTTSDVIRIDAAGAVIDGRWDVTPAIHIHTELHRRRPDARVVVHNHPYHVVVLAALGLLPQVLHQTACMYDGDLVFVDEYGGEIDDAGLGAELADAIGDASVIVLANHGLIVTGPTIAQATYRAASIDRQCRLTLDVLRCGGSAREVPAATRHPMKRTLLERAADVYWAGAVRQLIAQVPGVLD